MKLSIILCLVSLFTCTFCEEDCEEEARLAWASILCEGVFVCANETNKLWLDNYRNCYGKSGELAKNLIEEGNKLETKKCINYVFEHICPFVNDTIDNPYSYGECVKDVEHLGPVMNSCTTPVFDEMIDDLNKSLQVLASVNCADISKVSCETTDAMEVFELIKSCLHDHISGMKDIKTDGDKGACISEAKEAIAKGREHDEFKGASDCLNSKKELVDANEPDKKCTGF